MTRKTFEKLILRLKEQLYCFAYSILKDRCEAQDAVQEIVLKLWKIKDKLDETKNINSFCMSMIHNHYLDIIRKQKQSEKFILSTKIVEPENPRHDHVDLVEKIKSELPKLPLQQRTAIELKAYYKKLSKIKMLTNNSSRNSEERIDLYQEFMTQADLKNYVRLMVSERERDSLAFYKKKSSTDKNEFLLVNNRSVIYICGSIDLKSIHEFEQIIGIAGAAMGG